jgi:hypothetical protein
MMLSLGANTAPFRSIDGDGVAAQRRVCQQFWCVRCEAQKAGASQNSSLRLWIFVITSRRISRSTSVEREFKKMKTFIVYDLDSQMPVAVGEQVSAETARYCASVATGIFQANLLAEEIDLQKQVTY